MESNAALKSRWERNIRDLELKARKSSVVTFKRVVSVLW